MTPETTADWNRLKELWVGGEPAGLQQIPALCLSLELRLRMGPAPSPDLAVSIARLAALSLARATQALATVTATGRYSPAGTMETANYVPTIGWEA